LTYRWTGPGDPADVVSPKVRLGEGTHIFTLSVTNNLGQKDTDQVRVVILGRLTDPGPAPSYSRFLTDPFEVYSFHNIQAQVNAIRQEGHRIPTGHPRIFINPGKKESIRQKIMSSEIYMDWLQSLVDMADEYFNQTITGHRNNVRGQEAVMANAFVYQVGQIPGINYAHSIEDYGREGVRHLLTPELLNESVYRHDDYIGLPLGYDWLFHLMTHSQKVTVANQLLTISQENERVDAYNNPPGAELLGPLALYGDHDIVDQNLVQAELDRFHDGRVFGEPRLKVNDQNLTFNHIFVPEGPGHEGLGYSTWWHPLYPLLLAWRDQTGEDYFKLSLFQRWPALFTHLTGNEDEFMTIKNSKRKGGSYGNTLTATMAYLELGVTSNNWDMTALLKFQQNRWPTVERRPLIILLQDPDIPAKSPEELHLRKTDHFRGANYVTARDRWDGVDATWVWFRSPTWTHIRDLGPLNDLIIRKNGGYLLKKHLQYHKYEGGNRTNTLVLYDETDPGMTYIPQNVMDGARNRVLGISLNKGDSIHLLSKDLIGYAEGLRYFEDKPGQYMYVFGDGNQPFQNTRIEDGGTLYKRIHLLDDWTRQVIWFRAANVNEADYFFVLDRTQKSRDTIKEHLRFNFGANPEIRDRLTNQDLGSGHKEFQGKWTYTKANRIVATNNEVTDWQTNHGRLFIDTLYPHAVNYYRMGGLLERNIDIFGNLRRNRHTLDIEAWRVQIET
jgi:hypothetical protein